MQTQYAVCHLQRGKGNDSGMSCHIERKTADGKIYVPDNADKSRTALNRELITFPEGVKNRTEAIKNRLENARLQRKVGKNQTRDIRIILTGTHEQMMKINGEGNLDKWIGANINWLKKTFGDDNLVSCVLHMDEKTPHLHATIVPIIDSERKRRAREGEKKYRTKTSGLRLSADDVMARYKLKEYQDSYGKAMKPFGLERGVVGSTAKHLDRTAYYKQEEIELQKSIDERQDDITRLLAEVEKAKEGKSLILSLFGKGDLAKAKKELNSKEEEVSRLKSQIKYLQKSNAEQAEKHKQEIRSLKNGYQMEIDKAIQRAEDAEKKVAKLEKSNEIKSKQISALERKAYPKRYTLTSGAKLTHLFVPNYMHPSLHIWTKVGNEEYENTKYDVDYNVARAHRDGQMTDEEFVNAVFEPMEQVNQIQAQLLGAAFVLASGGPAQAHVGTGGGGSSSDLPWGEKKKDKNGMRR